MPAAISFDDLLADNFTNDEYVIETIEVEEFADDQAMRDFLFLAAMMIIVIVLLITRKNN